MLRAGGGAGLLGLLLAAGMLRPGEAQAAILDRAAFDATSMADALKALGAGSPTAAAADDSGSAGIILVAPEIAENGAVVPISATSKIPKTEAIAILTENNPNTLSAYFTLPEGTEAFVSTRVKMAQTSSVVVLVRADGKFYVASKDVKVTIGGCGG